MRIKNRSTTTHTEPAPVRRKLVESYRKLANAKRFTEAERAEFARMADAWQKTLSDFHKISVDERR